MWSIAAFISAGVLFQASCSNLVVPFTIGYGDQTLGGHCCFRQHLAELTFDTSGSKTVVTEILALRGGVSLLKEYFEREFEVAQVSLEDISGPLAQYLVKPCPPSRNRALALEADRLALSERTSLPQSTFVSLSTTVRNRSPQPCCRSSVS